MAIEFQQAGSFLQEREHIEQHLYNSVFEIEKDEFKALKSIQNFAEAFERLMSTLEQMYQNPERKDSKGIKSFPIHEGRYRIFYKIIIVNSVDIKIVFLDIDDNKQSNLDRFPEHKMITFNDEE